jgi:uncharacterized membrane protein
VKTGIFVKLLGVLAIHLAMIGLYWAIVSFVLATQDNLSPSVLERTEGDVQRIAANIAEVSGAMLSSGLVAILIGAILACVWLLLIENKPPIGSNDARRKRGSWAGLLLVALIAGGATFYFLLIGAPVAEMLAANVPLQATIAGLVLLALGYWVGTGVLVVNSAKIAVLGGGIFGA